MQIEITLAWPPTAYLQWRCYIFKKKNLAGQIHCSRHLSNLLLSCYILSIEFSNKCAILGETEILEFCLSD